MSQSLSSYLPQYEISLWYTYKCGHTRLLCPSIRMLIFVLYTQVQPNVQVHYSFLVFITMDDVSIGHLMSLLRYHA
jgi:hypothetical protein